MKNFRFDCSNLAVMITGYTSDPMTREEAAGFFIEDVVRLFPDLKQFVDRIVFIEPFEGCPPVAFCRANIGTEFEFVRYAYADLRGLSLGDTVLN